MSHVTDVIITCSVMDEDKTWSLNAMLETRDDLAESGAWLNRVDDKAAGSKAMQAAVLIGAFGYLDIDKFVEAVRAHPWYCPEDVQIFMKDEHEDKFTER